ncbi:hypothetical protein LXL04_021709 [Taraxacum kok-saghyz]
MEHKTLYFHRGTLDHAMKGITKNYTYKATTLTDSIQASLKAQDSDSSFTQDSITAQVLAAKRATGFNYSTIQLQRYSITAEFNYISQHYNQPNRALE